MRAFGKFLGRTLLVLVLAGGLLWWFGPYEPADLAAEFDSRKFGEGVQVYFETVESAHDDITPGVEKRVIWQPGFEERRTPVSILYIHGFSATSEEIRPVPDRVADALGANLVYTRLQGHGRPGAAMAEARVAGWMQDVAEGLAAARAVGEQVVVMGTSTGGTLATAAAFDPALSAEIAALVLVSPNFAPFDPKSRFLTWPAARYWVPLVEGPTRSFVPANEGAATYWTVSYPVTALLPMAALVQAVGRFDFTQATIPALFRISDQDQVVRAEVTRAIAGRWGAPAVLQVVEMGEGDDPSSHVIAGAIMSPGQTDAAVTDILGWLRSQGIE